MGKFDVKKITSEELQKLDRDDWGVHGYSESTDTWTLLKKLRKPAKEKKDGHTK